MKSIIIKGFISKIAMYLINLGYSWLFNKVDSNRDGKWSKKEIESFVNLISQKAKARIAKKKQDKLK